MFGQLRDTLESLWFSGGPPSFGESARELASMLGAMDFEDPQDFGGVFRQAIQHLEEFDVHTTRVGYLGLFNPHPTFPSVVAEVLVSIFCCQLGSRSHCAIGVETEDLLIRYFGQRFGFDPTQIDGVFTTGASESIITAFTAALSYRWPEVLRSGLRSLPNSPLVYASSQTHHSLHKALRVLGMGGDALREIPVDEDCRIDTTQLRQSIEADLCLGFAPWLVVANFGTTASGAIDPIVDLAELCRTYHLWLHIDAAWGGGAILSDDRVGLFVGVEKADSISVDAHKWLAMPPACGLLLLRHPGLLVDCFHAENTYMKDDRSAQDPFNRTIQWTRRFNGLKLFMTLATLGRKGYEQMIEHQMAVADHLREALQVSGWTLANSSPLPIICFQHSFPSSSGGNSDRWHERILAALKEEREFWLSTVYLPGKGVCLRACVTNFRTTFADVQVLVEHLAVLRRAVTFDRISGSEVDEYET